MKVITGFFMAWGNFCAIPCPYKRWDETARKHMLAELPLIGLLIGVLWYGIWWVCDQAAVPQPLQAAVLTAHPFLVTGFIHLDGYMDCNDAILSRRPLEERQRILKDSHVGAFAVITAILMFLFFYSGILSLIQQGAVEMMKLLIVVPVISGRCLCGKCCSIALWMKVSIVSLSGGAAVRAFARAALAMWFAAVALGLILRGPMDMSLAGMVFPLSAVMIQTAVSLAAGAYGRMQLGGMNGDISGYCIVLSETAAVTALAFG